MEPFSFEELPKAVTKLYAKMKKIERLLKDNVLLLTKQEELLSIDEASELLKLSVSTIYSKVCRHELPASKQGKRLYFYRSELMEWIREGNGKSNEELRQLAERYIKDRKAKTS